MNRTLETGNMCSSRYGIKSKPSAMLLRMICCFIIFLTKPCFIRVLRMAAVTAGAMLFLLIVSGMESGTVPLIIGTPVCFFLGIIAFAAAEKCNKKNGRVKCAEVMIEGCFDK